MKNNRLTFEICAPSVQSAIHADLGGADRIELCQNLAEGGTTPSFGSIQYCVENLSLKTYVLIRPRPGDFCYNKEEFEVIKKEVQACKELGVHGVVVGFLNPDRSLDGDKTKEIRELAGPMQLTFHRAIDICSDWRSTLRQLIEIGYDRVLTSGTAPTAFQGIPVLKEMVQEAQGRIVILAGSGVNYMNGLEIVNQTGVRELHASCTTIKSTQDLHISPDLYLDSSNYEHKESDFQLIKKLVSLQIV